MQDLGDVLVGLFLIFIGYKLFLQFGVWAEKRAERIAQDAKKGIDKNG